MSSIQFDTDGGSVVVFPLFLKTPMGEPRSINMSDRQTSQLTRNLYSFEH
jgi:hypothetical protein